MCSQVVGTHTELVDSGGVELAESHEGVGGKGGQLRVWGAWRKEVRPLLEHVSGEEGLEGTKGRASLRGGRPRPRAEWVWAGGEWAPIQCRCYNGPNQGSKTIDY